MELAIRRFKGEAGERFSILVDESGMPLYYPALYATAELRGASLSITTIHSALHAIKAIYAWQEYYGIDLESRFKRSELLQAHEVHSLRDFMQKPMDSMLPEVETVVAINRQVKRVSKDTQYNRMTIGAEYLGFLAGRLLPTTSNSAKEIAAMVSQVKANRPKFGDKTEKDRSAATLDDNVLDALEEMLAPGNLSNPVADIGLQYRNALMFIILRVTGMRRGELLNLKIEDFDFARNTVKVVRRADSGGDPRTYQPLTKTKERTIPLIPELMDKIHSYVTKYRNGVPGARKHGYLFVVHRPGRTLGWPLSNSGFGKFIEMVSGLIDDTTGLHAHALRHQWNYVFSKKCEASGWTPEKIEKMRSYIMGWSETSGTAQTYNKKYVREAADKAVVAMQEKYLRADSNGR